MYRAFEALLEDALDAAIADGALTVADRPACRLEPPEGERFGDGTSRIAMVVASRSGRPAADIARVLTGRVRDPHGWIECLDVAGPGFVNVRASLAFWRSALADRVWAAGGIAPCRGEALVCVDTGPDSEAEPRATLVADVLARLFRAVGYRVPAVLAGVAGLAGVDVTAVERAVVIHAAADGGAVRRARSAFGAVGGRPGRLTTLGVAPATVRHRGRTVPAADALALLRRPTARLDVLAIPTDDPADVEVDRLAAQRVDAPWIAMRYARSRIARATGAGTPPPTALEALGDPERGCLRAVGFTPDVVALAARRLEPARLVTHGRALAAAFHRYYNRGAFADPAADSGPARRALAHGIGRALDDLTMILGTNDAERG